MRNKLLILLLFSVCFSQSIAQNKFQRRIYLWDVTLSMKGWNGKTPDIYDDVVDFLKREINSLTDEKTEIIVLPFQESILDEWITKASEAGKKEIIDKIEKYNNGLVTNTNIVQPIRTAQSKYIKDDRRNLLFLLTDGKQSGGNQELLATIRNWERFAEINNAYAVYVMLTKEAIDDEVVDIIQMTERIDVVTKPGKFDVIDLQPVGPIRLNIKDEIGKPVNIPLTYKKNIELPDGIKVSIESFNDSIIHISETSEIKDQTISFNLEYNYSRLKDSLGERTRIPLMLKLLNEQEIKNETGKVILLDPKEVVLELINRPEKTLRIYVK